MQHNTMHIAVTPNDTRLAVIITAKTRRHPNPVVVSDIIGETMHTRASLPSLPFPFRYPFPGYGTGRSLLPYPQSIVRVGVRRDEAFLP